MIEVGTSPISPERVINSVRNERSGCVVTYVGLIRGNSHGKAVSGVEYEDLTGNAAAAIKEICEEAKQRWPVEDIAMSHRSAKLVVGDINLVVAVSAAHRREGFAACRYVIDQFKRRLPTSKTETYKDGTARLASPSEGQRS